MLRIAAFLCVVVVVCNACPPQCNSCDNGMVNCAQSGLRDIPRQFPQDIISIDLTGNQITELNEDSFKDSSAAQSLVIPSNGISSIGARAFVNLPQLTSLDLSGNPLTSIHDEAFVGLDELRMLSLNSNKLRTLGQPFKNLSALSNLNLGLNQLERIDEDDFQNNVQLRIIDLSNNRITSIHQNAFKNLRILRYLILTNNFLTQAVNLDFTSGVLQLVDFTKCRLTEVPKTMPASVRDLRLGDNEITGISDESFKGMTNLRILTLNNNKIRNITYRSLRNLTSLSELWLSYNKMFYIPHGLPNNLEKLHMDHNDIYEVESKIFTNESHIKVLTLEMNKIQNIYPDAFEGLSHLEDLNFQINNLKVIKSNTFSNLPALKTLQMSTNPLQTIQRNGFTNLPNLTSLSMSYLNSENASTVSLDFLEGISNVQHLHFMNSRMLVKAMMELFSMQNAPTMSKVQTFDLQYNELKTLPSALQTLIPNVQKVYLDGNPFHCDKNLIWLKQWMQNTNMAFYSRESVKCGSPNEVQDQEIVNLSDGSFVETTATEVQVERLEISGSIQTTPANPLTTGSPASTMSPAKAKKQAAKAKKLKKKRKGRKRKGKKRKNKKKKNRKRRNRKNKNKQRRSKRRIRKKRCKLQPDGTLRCLKRRRKPTKKIVAAIQPTTV